MISVRHQLTLWLMAGSAAAGGCVSGPPPWNLAADQPKAVPARQSPAAPAAQASATDNRLIIRNQLDDQRASPWIDDVVPGGDYYRHPMAVSGTAASPQAALQTAPAAAPTGAGHASQGVQQVGFNTSPSLGTPGSVWNSYPGYNPTPAPQAQAAPPGNGGLNSAPGVLRSAPPGSPTPGSPPPTGMPAGPGTAPPTGYVNGSAGQAPPPGLPLFSPTNPFSGSPTAPAIAAPPPPRFTDIIVNVEEAQTGRLMIGAAVNSEAGLTGQIVIDEKNFDWRAFPRSFDDVVQGRAFRGGGQGLRIEALPGSQVQRYMVNFTQPYLANTNISMNVSGYLFDRAFADWDEQRLGGRLAFGYRITPDMSLSLGFRGEQVNISDPATLGVPALDEVLGDNELYSGRLTLTQDTRDIPFVPTQGYFLELSYEQVFGTYDYPQAIIDYRRYFLVTERPDGSGRHVLAFWSRTGFSGSQTPIFENFFAGGYSTLRGFDFRGASPEEDGVRVGGEFQLLGSAEYFFPITADDMIKGVVFADYGTVEQKIQFDRDNYRIALGAGLRVSVPAMGPAPIALDFAVPVSRADTDNIRQFSFFFGVNR